MRVFIASDHGGFREKAEIAEALRSAGHEVTDLGPHTEDPGDDYPAFAVAVGRAVQADPESRGILLCRSGEGMEIAVNKIAGVRGALVWRPDIAAETRRDNDANVIVLPGDFVAVHDMHAIVNAFLNTSFSTEERHHRRVEQITAIEKGEL